MRWWGREQYDTCGRMLPCGFPFIRLHWENVGRVEEATLGDRTASELVSWAAEGDQAAWDALVDRYAGLVWSVARAHRLAHPDVADVVQTTWLRLVENLDRIRQPERVGAWLASTTRHECLRVVRRSTRERPTQFAYDAPWTSSTEPSAEATALERAGSRLILEALDELSERCRSLLRMLAATPQPSYADVAGVLDIPVGSIGPTRARCLDRFRRLLAAREAIAGRHEGE